MGIELVVAFLLANWEWIIIFLLVADKVVAASPTKVDDIILTILKKILYVFVPNKEKKDDEGINY